jgi:UPF0271 protein
MAEAARTVDLNADLGEGLDDAPPDTDEALLQVVTSAHIACGFHAGDPAVMRRTVALAVANGVAVGAHPSYPDTAGFGRRAMDIPPEQVAVDVLYQLGALDAIARAEGAMVRSVKPHGALYWRLAGDPVCASVVARAVTGFRSDLQLVLPAGSDALRAAAEAGAGVRAEGFCDRSYLTDGSLAPRSEPGALVTDPAEAARRAVSLVVDHVVPAVDGSELWLEVDTLCVHSDTTGAPAIAREVRAALEGIGVQVVAPAGG